MNYFLMKMLYSYILYFIKITRFLLEVLNLLNSFFFFSALCFKSYESSKDFDVFAEFVVFVVTIIFPYKYLSPLLKIPQANRLYHSTYIVQKYLPHSPDLFFLLYQLYSESTY